MWPKPFSFNTTHGCGARGNRAPTVQGGRHHDRSRRSREVKHKHACTAQKRIAMAELSHHEVCHTGENERRCDKHLLLITHLIHGWRFYR
jgi:hypothetical protein